LAEKKRRLGRGIDALIPTMEEGARPSDIFFTARSTPPEEPARAATGTPDRPAVRILERAAGELTEYFAGEREEFTVPVDLRLTGFRGEVVQFLPYIGYGRRASY